MLLALIAWAAVVLVAVPMTVVIVEIVAALLCRRRPAARTPANWPHSVVLVPAHNEGSVIADTLRSLAADLPPNARIRCIAHNCTDDTAAIARAFDAEVIEVKDDGTGGKPAALIAGLGSLDTDPASIVVIVDADCSVERGTLAALVAAVHASGKPAMGSYLFSPARPGDPRATMSSLAIHLKNHIRPLGLSCLGLPCLINGSGSAYPFAAVRRAPHGQGSVAEDFQLSIDLLRQGFPTTFVPEARILGRLPGRSDTAFRQRRRWEHGHLALVLATAPRLALEGLFSGDWRRLTLALEVGVPPLGLLALGSAATIGLALLAAITTGSAAPLVLVLGVCFAFVAALLLACGHFLGWSLTQRALRALPGYLLWKLPLYLGFLGDRERQWRKTERD